MLPPLLVRVFVSQTLREIRGSARDPIPFVEDCRSCGRSFTCTGTNLKAGKRVTPLRSTTTMRDKAIPTELGNELDRTKLTRLDRTGIPEKRRCRPGPAVLAQTISEEVSGLSLYLVSFSFMFLG